MTSLDGADADRGQSAVTRAGCAEEFPTAPMASGPLVREVVSMHYQPITQSRRRQRVYRRAVAAYFSRVSSFTEIELAEHEFCRRCQVKPRSLPLPLLLPPLQCMHGGIERRRRRKMRETSPVRVRSFIRPLLSLIPFALQRRRRLRVTGGGAEGAGMRPIKEGAQCRTNGCRRNGSD